ncbi:MAG: hypothetical protein QM811_01285 [Pirellulales bacterium]
MSRSHAFAICSGLLLLVSGVAPLSMIARAVEPISADNAETREFAERTRKLLNASITLDVRNANLSDIVTSLERQSGVRFKLGWYPRFDPRKPNITAKFENVALRDVLDQLLTDRDLDYGFESNETLVIVDGTKVFHAKLYPIRDLREVYDEPDAQQLIATTQRLVHPRYWKEEKGFVMRTAESESDTVKDPNLLVVSATKKTHRDLAAYFQCLRDVNGLNIK